MRFAAVLASLLVLMSPAAASAGRAYWSVAKVLRRVDDIRIRVGTKRVRIHAETTLCAGKGRAIRRAGVKRWNRFACTYTTFTQGGIDRDLDFGIVAKGTTRFAVVDPHWVRATR